MSTERVIKIPENVATVRDLALATEGALNEIDTLRRGVQFPTFKKENPQGGDAMYNQSTDKIEIYNSQTKLWVEQ